MSHKDLTPQQSELYIFVEEFKKLQGEFFEKFGDEDITDRQTRTMPLSIIPELTEELYKKAINWSALSESTKKLRTDNGASASDEELADGLIDTRMNSIIELGSDADFRK